MGATPAVVVTHGGSALAICFNTIAILVRRTFVDLVLARACIYFHSSDFFSTRVYKRSSSESTFYNACACSNTQFVLDVDNLSYSFGLGERARERVDSCGHVDLTDAQARRLSRTKVLSVSVVLVVTLWLVDNGASVAAMLSGYGMALAFKLSELIATYGQMSHKDVAIFVVASFVVQWVSYNFFIRAIILPWYEVKG
eukprot:SAG31_NODE_2583_length_5435_cov_55.000000_4_plen_198_part_00